MANSVRTRKCSLLLVVHYCTDVLQLDTTRAKEYLTAVSGQAERQIRRQPVDRRQLEVLGKWIDWEDAVKGADVLKQRFERAEGKAKAIACQKYVLYLFYTCLPPGRAHEYATMEIIDQRHRSQQSVRGNTNACIISIDGKVSLRFGEYKTERSHGVQVITLSSNPSCSEHLVPVILAYIDEWRPVLAGSSDNRMFFVKDGGAPYSAINFSQKVRYVTREATGVNVGVAVLRKSFVTHFCGSGSTHRGIAAAMRHTELMQRKVYNVTTLEEDLAAGLDKASSYFSQVLAAKTSCSGQQSKN